MEDRAHHQPWAPGEFNLSCLPEKWWQCLHMLLPEMMVCIALAQPVVSTGSEGWSKPSDLYLGQRASTFMYSFRPMWIWGRCMNRLPMQLNLKLDTGYIHFIAIVKSHLKSSGQPKPIMVLAKKNKFPTTLWSKTLVRNQPFATGRNLSLLQVAQTDCFFLYSCSLWLFVPANI